MAKLVVRSVVVLVLLLGLLFSVGLVALRNVGAPLWMAVAFAVAIVGLQYLAGPAILSWLFRIRWVEPGELPEGLGQELLELCGAHAIPVPRLGLIDDGHPNAFTFGHYPGNARLVVTTGLLDALTPEEAKAVLAHELGHIKHWDFVVMTVASLIPMLLYTIYVWTRNGNRKNGSGVVGLGAYAAYLISQFVVLALSRIREYYADAFAAEVTGSGEPLARALVKIAYGLTRNRLKPKPKMTKEERRARLLDQRLEAAGALGIASGKAPSAFALAAVGAEGQEIVVERAMRWDLKNPWAKWYELFSTHPLTARRIRALGGLVPTAAASSSSAATPFYAEPYGLGQFLVDLVIRIIPWVVGLWTGLFTVAAADDLFTLHGFATYGAVVGIPFGLLMLHWTLFTYRRGFTDRTAAELISQLHVSEVRPIPAVLHGTVVGRGIPGLFYSEDLVLQDETGYVVLDYRQPWALFDFLFGILKAEKFIGQEVTVVGWYRRNVAPRLEVKYLELSGGKRSYCFPYYLYLYGSLAALLGGVALFLFGR